MTTRIKLDELWARNSAALLARLDEPGIAQNVQALADRLTMTNPPAITLRADLTIRDGHQRVLAAHLAGREIIECVFIN